MNKFNSEKETTGIKLRRVEEDLEDLERYIKEFTSFLPLAICTVNPPKIIIDINQALQNLTGYSAIEITGEPLEKIFSEKKGIDGLLKKTQKEGGIKNEELSVVSKSNKQIPVAVSVSTRKDVAGKFIGYFLAIADITETKKTHEELEKRVRTRTQQLDNSRKALMNILEDVENERKKAEEEKNKTLTIIANFSDGLLVLDENSRISLANPQIGKFFNVPINRIVGRSVSEITEITELALLTNLLKKEIRGIFRKELEIRKDLTLEISTISMSNQGKEFGVLVILHDITREKTVEKIKTEFVSLSAHQLRTPLAAIKWTLRMLLDGDLGEINKEQREILEKSYQSNERMIALINDLLDITRIEEGKYIYRTVLTDLADLVHFVVNSSKDEAAKRNLKIEFKKAGDKMPKIAVDVEKIRLVIQNFIDNAMKYTPAGGKINIFLRYLEESKEIEFSVKDSGVGIPLDQQPRVFTKFFRGANVVRMDTEGSGLGLFICKNIIEAHGGKVWFESKENEGATFYFTLSVGKEFEEFLKEF